MRDAIVKAQPSNQFRTGWKDLEPTVEALIIPKLVSEIRQDITETAQRFSVTHPASALCNQQSAASYMNIKEACREMSKPGKGFATYVSLDYSSAILLSVILQNMTAIKVVFVDSKPALQALTNSEPVVYIGIDDQY